MKTYKITGLAILTVLACTSAKSDVVEGRLRELEKICAFIPCDNLSENEIEPTPEDVKERFNMSNAEIVDDLLSIAMRIGPNETNFFERVTRANAIHWIGQYGATNDVLRLQAVTTNSCDFAQNEAASASVAILRNSVQLIPFVRNMLTNCVVYSDEVRERRYVQLLAMSSEPESDYYITDATQRARVAAFFMERAAVETNDTLFIDRCAYTLNPTYRHSQQRRDNLAALRPPGLTGKPAELYDAAQRDAAQTD